MLGFGVRRIPNRDLRAWNDRLRRDEGDKLAYRCWRKTRNAELDRIYERQCADFAAGLAANPFLRYGRSYEYEALRPIELQRIDK